MSESDDLKIFNRIFDGASVSVTDGTIFSDASVITANTEFSDGLNVTGGLVVDGVDIAEALKQIADRLLILQPDLEKNEKYEALKDAYEQYKMLEKLLEDGE